MKKTVFWMRFVDGHEEKNIRAFNFAAAEIIAQHRRLERQKGIISHHETKIAARACEIVHRSNTELCGAKRPQK